MDLEDLAEKDILILEHMYSSIDKNYKKPTSFIGKKYEFFISSNNTKDIYTPSILYGKFITEFDHFSVGYDDKTYELKNSILNNAAYYKNEVSFIGTIKGWFNSTHYSIDLNTIEYSESSKKFLIERKKFLIESMLQTVDIVD